MKSAVLLFALLLWPGWRTAADAFLQLDGVSGAPRSDRYSGWIPVTAFSSKGASAKAAGGATPLLVAVKGIDAASPMLAQKCAEGARIANAILEFTVTNSSGAGFFFQIRFTNVVVVAIQESGSPGVLSETVQLVPASLQWTYTQLTGRKVTLLATPRYQPASAPAGNDSGSTPFRSSGSLLPNGFLSLQWTLIPGRAYRLTGAAHPEGPFQFLRPLPSPATGGTGSIEIPMEGDFQFFKVELE